MFQMNSKFLQKPWYIEAIHYVIYTLAELCCIEKEQNYYGDGVQHDGNQAFSK